MIRSENSQRRDWKKLTTNQLVVFKIINKSNNISKTMTNFSNNQPTFNQHSASFFRPSDISDPGNSEQLVSSTAIEMSHQRPINQVDNRK